MKHVMLMDIIPGVFSPASSSVFISTLANSSAAFSSLKYSDEKKMSCSVLKKKKKNSSVIITKIKLKNLTGEKQMKHSFHKSSHYTVEERNTISKIY